MLRLFIARKNEGSTEHHGSNPGEPRGEAERASVSLFRYLLLVENFVTWRRSNVRPSSFGEAMA